MAKKLSSVEQLINQTSKYSKVTLKNNPLYLGGTKKERFFNWNRDASVLRDQVKNAIDNIYEEVRFDIRGLTKDIMTDIRASLSSLPLESFDHKQLTVIADYVSDVNRVLYDLSIEEKKMNLNNPVHSAKLATSRQTLEIYKDALMSVQDILHDVEKEDVFNANAYAEIINDIDLNAINENDIALARAFSFIGSPLTYENGKWKFDEKASKASPNGIKFQDSFGREAVYKLPETNVRAFVDGYLNKPIEERNGKVISPSGLFRFYAESIGNSSTNLSKLDQSKIDALVSEAKVQFSTDNAVWQSYLVADEISARRDASRLALADIFEEQFSGRDMENNEVFSRELQASIDQNIEGNTLDRLESVVAKAHTAQVASREDNRFGISSLDEIVNKYQAEHAKLSRELVTAGDHKNVIQSRIEDITKSTATLIAIREMQKDLVTNVLEKYNQDHDQTDTANDQNRFALIEKTFKDLGIMDFVSVVEQDGRWFVDFDETKVPDEYKYYITKSHYDIKHKINNIINTKMSKGFDINYDLSDEESLKLSTEDIYDIIFNSNLGSEPTLSQVLVDEAIMDRTVALLNGPENAFQRTYLDYFNKTDDPSIEGLVAKLNELGEDLDNFAFTTESLTRYRDQSEQKRAIDELNKRYVIMYRMGNALNANVELLKSLNANDLESNRPMLAKLYQMEMDNYKDNPPSQLELDRAKSLFANLNKKKDFERINNYPLREGEPPVSLIDELVKDPAMRQILKDREKTINEKYQQEVDAERKNRFNGANPDEKIVKEKEEKEKPYTYKQKFGKNNGSSTLKKLKPYCKKSSQKFIDDLLKMFDATIIVPQPKIKTSTVTNDLSEVYDIDNDPIRNAEIDLTSKKPEPKVVEEDEKEEKNEIDPKDLEDESLEKLQSEIEKRGKYAYLASGRILNQSITGKHIGWENADMSPNESELASIKSLISILDYIGAPEKSVDQAKMKIALLDLIEAKANNAGELIKTNNDKVASLLGQVRDENLKSAIEYIISTPEDIHFVWALELSSELSAEGNSGKLKLGSKLEPGTIQQIKDNPQLVDTILQSAGHFEKNNLQEACKIWADAIVVEKKPYTTDDLLNRIEANPDIEGRYVNDARAWNSTSDQYMRGKNADFEDNLIKHQMLNEALSEGIITQEQADEYRRKISSGDYDKTTKEMFDELYAKETTKEEYRAFENDGMER